MVQLEVGLIPAEKIDDVSVGFMDVVEQIGQMPGIEVVTPILAVDIPETEAISISGLKVDRVLELNKFVLERVLKDDKVKDFGIV